MWPWFYVRQIKTEHVSPWLINMLTVNYVLAHAAYFAPVFRENWVRKSLFFPKRFCFNCLLMSVSNSRETPSAHIIYSLLWLIHTARERARYRDREREKDQWILIHHEEMFTLVWDRDRDKDQDSLFPIVLVPYPVLVPFPVLCRCAINPLD